MTSKTPEPDTDPFKIVELRQYRLRPGRRDELIELFDRELLEPQEAVGMRVIGQFRDLDDPDRFVWLRGFADMESRRRALTAFYDGPVWAAHRDAANATMVDSDDVLLLRPSRAGSAFGTVGGRPAPATPTPPTTAVIATILPLRRPADEAFVEFFEREAVPVLTATGAAPTNYLQTEPATNTFPRLPVRTDETVFVWFSAFPTWEEQGRHVARLERSDAWAEFMRELAPWLAAPIRLVRLVPTARSRLGRPPVVAGGGLPTGEVHDFDFITGCWTVRNRRLRGRGVGSDEWDEFGGCHRGWQMLGGMANVDEMACPSQGFSGMSVRAFDPEARRWSIRWISSTRGVVEPPLFGGFDGDHGVFYGDDLDDGRPVQVRFDWWRRGPLAARWEQAFSYDGGASWEVNWTMDFTREAPRREEGSGAM